MTVYFCWWLLWRFFTYIACPNHLVWHQAVCYMWDKFVISWLIIHFKSISWIWCSFDTKLPVFMWRRLKTSSIWTWGRFISFMDSEETLSKGFIEISRLHIWSKWWYSCLQCLFLRIKDFNAVTQCLLSIFFCWRL